MMDPTDTHHAAIRECCIQASLPPEQHSRTADFAAETANLSRAPILQQAGTAMVAQANQLPQGVLSLLKG